MNPVLLRLVEVKVITDRRLDGRFGDGIFFDSDAGTAIGSTANGPGSGIGFSSGRGIGSGAGHGTKFGFRSGNGVGHPDT